jgi:hypothetical protein
MRYPSTTHIVCIVFGISPLALSQGCVQGGPGPIGIVAHTVSPPKAADGPYRDITPALRHAASLVKMAVVDTDVSDPTRWRYTLTTTRDERVTVDLHFAADLDPSLPATPTRIVAHIAPFGDPPRERELVAEIDARLEELRTTGIAPGLNAD